MLVYASFWISGMLKSYFEENQGMYVVKICQNLQTKKYAAGFMLTED